MATVKYLVCEQRVEIDLFLLPGLVSPTKIIEAQIEVFRAVALAAGEDLAGIELTPSKIFALVVHWKDPGGEVPELAKICEATTKKLRAAAAGAMERATAKHPEANPE